MGEKRRQVVRSFPGACRVDVDEALDARASHEELRRVKALIQKMTSYKPTHRPKSEVVATQTALIHSTLTKSQNKDRKAATTGDDSPAASSASGTGVTRQFSDIRPDLTFRPKKSFFSFFTRRK